MNRFYLVSVNTYSKIFVKNTEFSRLDFRLLPPDDVVMDVLPSEVVDLLQLNVASLSLNPLQFESDLGD